MFPPMDSAVEQRQLAPGTMLDDKYRVESLLAMGGMGAVYVGTHTKLRKRVAIKVLNPSLNTPQMIERFHREAITASQVGHEGIAQVTDLGTSTNGEPFLVMELLEGESLAKRLRTTGPLPIEVACEMACSILAPLGAAHATGIVHRDLKPDNVFLVQQSRGEMVKLLDFGISRAAGLDAESRLTTTGLVLGTPFYMSPEQAQGSTEITAASDLYSVGVILYELLTGRVPIHGDNYNQVMYRVMTGSFSPPRQLRPDVPAALERVVLRAMALWPADRPRSADELEHDLLPFCRPTFRAHAIETASGAQRIGFQTPAPAHLGVLTPAGAMSSGVRSPSGGLLPPSGAGPVAQPAAPSSGAQPLAMSLGTDRTVQVPSGRNAALAPPARRRLPWLLAAAALVALGSLTAVLLPRGRGDTSGATSGGGDTASPGAGGPIDAGATLATVRAADAAHSAAAAIDAAQSAAAAIDAAQGAAADAAPTIRLRFALEPASARVTVDGAPVEGDELEVPRDGAEHALHITADGYQAEVETVRFDESQRIVVRLERERHTGRRPRGTSADRPPTKQPSGRTDRIESDSPYR